MRDESISSKQTQPKNPNAFTSKLRQHILDGMNLFHQSSWFANLVNEAPLNELGPGQRQKKACDLLSSEPLAELFAPHKPRDRNAARACVAGLLLLYDGLNESHSISQDLEDATGSYWHGIMHRREPDYGNAKYWFARVRRHPVYPLVAEAARELARKSLSDTPWPAANWLLEAVPWQAEAFVDLCQAARKAGEHADLLCRNIQRKECELLLDYCYRSAIGD